MSSRARVIGVVDLSEGLAVHAQGGARAHYGPVRALAGHPIKPGDARAIARWYVEGLGVREIYIADLDALRGRSPQHALIRALASFEAPLWLDSAVSSVETARTAVEDGANRVVVGLETLPSLDDLSNIVHAVGGSAVAFSLDLRRGEPLCSPGARHAHLAPEQLVQAAVAMGIRTVIVLDLARVGTRRGLDLNLLARVRQAAPSVELVVGGGVRGVPDLEAAAQAGCDAALVATALYDGRLVSADLAWQATNGVTSRRVEPVE
jgi:phosphoribosylformimino-5-aminoimidazole carboxamide ribotide isomerase